MLFTQFNFSEEDASLKNTLKYTLFIKDFLLYLNYIVKVVISRFVS